MAQNGINKILKTALILSKREKNKDEPMYSQYRELVSGIAKTKGFISGDSYRIDNILEESVKTAYYLTALHLGKYENFKLYNKNITLQIGLLKIKISII